MAELPDFAPDMPTEDGLVLLQALASAAKGHAGYGIPWRLTDFGDSSIYALDVKNTEASNSLGLRVLDSAGAVILRGNVAELRSDKPATFGSTASITGNATIGGTLGVTGNTTLGGTLAVTGLATIGGTLGVTGAISGQSTLSIASTVTVNNDKFVVTGTDGSLNIGPNKFTVAGSTGNTAIAGNTTIAGTLGVTGDLAVNGTKFNVTASNGNVSLAGDFAVNASKFVVTGANGNTICAGTMQITGVANLLDALNVTGNIAVNSTKFNVTAASGNVTFAGDLAINTSKFTVTASNGNTLIAGTLQAVGAVTLVDDLIVDTDTLFIDASTSQAFVGYTSRTGGYKFNVNGAMAVDGPINVFGADIAIDNDRHYYAEDSLGTQRSLITMTTGDEVTVGYVGGYVVLEGARLGFFGAPPGTKPDVSGSRGGNAALADLLTELATMGLITNSTTA